MVNKKQPDIRFSGFTDDWEQCEINDFGKQTFGGGTPKTSISKYWDGSVPWIQSSDVKEDVLKVTNPKKRISEDAIKSSATKLIPKDSIAVVTRVGVGKLALMDYDYATSQDFLSISGLRLDRWFATYSLYNILKREKNAVQGTSIKGLTKNDLLTKKVKIPKDRIEQGKIGVLLKQFDESISLHQQELTTLKQTKQGFLQKMFPKKGEKVPEVRFPGFTDDWMKIKLGKIIDISSASRVHKHEWTNSGVRFFRSSDVMATHNGNVNQKAFISNRLYEELAIKSGKVKKGDILVTGGGSVGMPYLINDNDPLYFKDADLIWLKNSGIIDGSFLYTFFMSPVFRRYIKSVSHVGTISHYTIDQAKETPIVLPEEDEQQKIGSFFKQFDETIALHQRELELLQLTKKAFLQKLFV